MKEITPSYYQNGATSCIDTIRNTQTKNMYIGFLDGNVKKYMWRWKDKGGLEDLSKAHYYLEKLIEVIESKMSSED